MAPTNYDTRLITEVQKGASNSIAILRLLTNEHFVDACSLKGLEATLDLVADSGELPLTHSIIQKAIEKRRQKRAEINSLVDQVKNLSALKELIMRHIDTENHNATETPAALMPKAEPTSSAGAAPAIVYPTAEDHELMDTVQTADGISIAKLLLNKTFMARCSSEGIEQVQQELQRHSPYPTLLTLLQPYLSTSTNS